MTVSMKPLSAEKTLVLYRAAWPDSQGPYPTKSWAVTTQDGLEVHLHRWIRSGGVPEGAKPVLLLHGASAGAQTFIGKALDTQRSLVEHLLSYGGGDEADGPYDVWAADWRGSGNLAEQSMTCDATIKFTFDQAARDDLVVLLQAMAQQLETEAASVREIRLLGHCMAGAVVCQALAEGRLKRAGIETPRVVISGLGLFFRVLLTARLKADDHPLQRILLAHAEERSFHPDMLICPEADARPAFGPLRKMYCDLWRPLGLAAKGQFEFEKALSFMFGLPYLPEQLRRTTEAGEDEGMVEAHIRAQFGAIPLQMFHHGAQDLRRGWAAPYEGFDEEGGQDFIDATGFEGVHMTLLTGIYNAIWHRDSIDRMFNWLVDRNGRASATKHVLPKFGHQDLYWGFDAPDIVFPLIVKGLG